MMLREDAKNLAADMPKYRVVNYGDKRFTVRATKRAIDGALGSRGAWMLQPYADLATTSGFNTDNLDDVRMIAELAVKNSSKILNERARYVSTLHLMKMVSYLCRAEPGRPAAK